VSVVGAAGSLIVLVIVVVVVFGLGGVRFRSDQRSRTRTSTIGGGKVGLGSVRTGAFRVYLPYDVTPKLFHGRTPALPRRMTAFAGVTSQGKTTLKAPVRTEPHPTSRSLIILP
jgi:hypothetical protein